MRTLFIALLAALILVGCSESPSPLAPGSTEPVTKHIYSLVLTTENVHQGDKDSGYVPYWIIPIAEPYDSVQVTVTTQMGPGTPVLIINDCVSLIEGGVKVYYVAGRVGPPLKVTVIVSVVQKAVVKHNQGGSW